MCRQTGRWKSSGCQPDGRPSTDLIRGEAMEDGLTRRQRDVEREREREKTKSQTREGSGRQSLEGDRGGREGVEFAGESVSSPLRIPIKTWPPFRNTLRSVWVCVWGRMNHWNLVCVTAISAIFSFNVGMKPFGRLQGIKEKEKRRTLMSDWIWSWARVKENISGCSHGTMLTSHTHTHTHTLLVYSVCYPQQARAGVAVKPKWRASPVRAGGGGGAAARRRSPDWGQMLQTQERALGTGIHL